MKEASLVELQLDSFLSLEKLRTTNSTSSFLLLSQHHHGRTRCEHSIQSHESSSNCQAQKALSWLKTMGIKEGKPEDLLDSATQSQRKVINQITGREDKPLLQMSSSLLSRRSKKGIQ